VFFYGFMIRKPLFTYKEIDVEKEAFLCVNGIGMLLFSTDVGYTYTFSFTIQHIKPYYGIKLKIRWEMLV
ncbi:hypothetical protein V7094_29445, partial [Priestia megaterium]